MLCRGARREEDAVATRMVAVKMGKNCIVSGDGGDNRHEGGPQGESDIVYKVQDLSSRGYIKRMTIYGGY